MTALIISNKEIVDIMKIVEYCKEPGLQVKGVSETLENEAKQQKDGFFSILLSTLGARLLRNLLSSKGTSGEMIGAADNF